MLKKVISRGLPGIEYGSLLAAKKYNIATGGFSPGLLTEITRKDLPKKDAEGKEKNESKILNGVEVQPINGKWELGEYIYLPTPNVEKFNIIDVLTRSRKIVLIKGVPKKIWPHSYPLHNIPYSYHDTLDMNYYLSDGVLVIGESTNQFGAYYDIEDKYLYFSKKKGINVKKIPILSINKFNKKSMNVVSSWISDNNIKNINIVGNHGCEQKSKKFFQKLFRKLQKE